MLQNGFRLTLAATMLAAGTIACADDAEIFFGSIAPPRPNVLFIIDTSGSMDALVNVRPAYDPAAVYDGPCIGAAIYWKKRANAPVADTTPPVCVGNDRYIDAQSFVCHIARTELFTLGIRAIGPVMQWNDATQMWLALDQIATHSGYVECRDDGAIDHGISVNDKKVPSNGRNGPYTADGALGAAWSQADSYVFYAGNYLNYYASAGKTEQKTRLRIAQETAHQIIDSAQLNGANVALMRFSSNAQGGFVAYPFTAIETARQAGGIHAHIDALASGDYTPISETLYEAYEYFTGGPLVFGTDSSSRALAPNDSSRYRKAIDRSCAASSIVYLTDGEPTQDVDANAQIERLIGKRCTATANGDANGQCLDDLAGYMAGWFRADGGSANSTDLFDDANLPTATLAEPQEIVRTHIIGFGDALPDDARKLLSEAATLGGGRYFSAIDDAALLGAFIDIAADATAVQGTFTPPVVAINAFNRTRTLDEVFFNVFQPGNRHHWIGNLKKYRVDANGALYDANDAAAIDLNTGYFKATARSFWSAASDGADAALGGAANLLTTQRKIYSYFGASKELTDAGNAVVVANNALTNAALGLSASVTPLERDNLINWIRGQDVPDLAVTSAELQTRRQMGDALHARSAAIVYDKDGDASVVVYVATNDGYLHAIDAANGAELWGFIPQELLVRMPVLHDNPVAGAGKRYGLDGDLVVHRFDRNGDGVIDPSVDRVHLYFGLRRGGRDYYALDVTRRFAPKFMWRNGASGSLTGLGETWSTPIIAHISYRQADGLLVRNKRIAVFAGGYDPSQDGGDIEPAAQARYRTDVIGNHLFIVDADTGEPLWRADPCANCGATYSTGWANSVGVLTHPKLLNSIPASVRAIDMNEDGDIDRMYVADTGARVWRFDIINGESLDKLVRGGVFASLGYGAGVGSDPADARRFYYAPDASLARIGAATIVNLAIGSGYRGHPLNVAIQDRIYGLRDPIALRAMTAAEYAAMDAAPIIDSPSAPQLMDVTDHAGPALPSTARGWKIHLGLGEKVLAEARTILGATLLPTFTPASTSNALSCVAHTGTNKLYAIRTKDGSPILDPSGTGIKDVADRSITLKQQGIASAATLLFPAGAGSQPPTTPACEPITDPTCKPAPPPAARCSNGMTPPAMVAYIGAERTPLAFANCPVKTIWKQHNVD